MFQSSVDMDKKLQKQQEIYKRLKLLGAGAYGKAYLVKQIKTESLFVIKQIIMSDMNQQEQQSALRQSKILQALQHPNIIRFKEVYRTSKMRLNIVMEYANGGDLAGKIKQAKKQSKYFEQSQILDWFTQICLGVKHIHDRKIIHRDLKAQNIFLTQENIVKIGDFGVSRVLQKTVMNARTVVGSPYYLSPQIIENKPYSFQTDVWSLGALLYQLCALSPPFTANNLQFLALKIVKGAYGQIPNQYSYQLKSLIKNMLNTDSSKRPNINKILTSRIMGKRISNFLTESKRMDQFSHTVIHNKNILEENSSKILKENSLLPPPNLINIENQMQNKSQICTSNINFQMQSPERSRPFTPLIGGQHKKGPNNFFNNGRKPSKKNFPSQLNNKYQVNLNDLIQIKPSALQQKVKLPKVSTNPSFFDKKKSQANVSKNIEKIQAQKVKQIPQTAFIKKRAQSKEINANTPLISNIRQQIIKIQKQQEKIQDIVGKWKKHPKILQKIENCDQKQHLSQEQTKQNISEIHKTQEITKKQDNQNKNVKRSQSSKRIICPTKKNYIASNKKQNQKGREKKTSITSKKTSRKQSVSQHSLINNQNMQIVSEQIKKKIVQQKEKNKKLSQNKSSSKIQKDKKKMVPKKGNTAANNRVQNINGAANLIKKPSIPSSRSSKKLGSNKGLEKLAQPPKLQYQLANDEDIESPQKIRNQEQQQKQIVGQQKSKSQRSQQQIIQEMYNDEEFQQYEEENKEKQNSELDEQEFSNLDQQKLSLNLSDSCRHQNQKVNMVKHQNYNKMVTELQNIQKMIAQANGIIETLPMFGQDLYNNNLLQLSEPSEQVIREDDSELESFISESKQDQIVEVGQIISCKKNQKLQSHNKTNIQINQGEQQNKSNCSSSQSCFNTNLTILSNQQHLETLKMNLQQLFGQNDIIFIHKILSQVIEKEGLEFSQKDIQKSILNQRKEINQILLKKYFRLIVTVIIMQQQQNCMGNNCQ